MAGKHYLVKDATGCIGSVCNLSNPMYGIRSDEGIYIDDPRQ